MVTLQERDESQCNRNRDQSHCSKQQPPKHNPVGIPVGILPPRKDTFPSSAPKPDPDNGNSDHPYHPPTLEKAIFHARLATVPSRTTFSINLDNRQACCLLNFSDRPEARSESVRPVETRAACQGRRNAVRLRSRCNVFSGLKRLHSTGGSVPWA